MIKTSYKGPETFDISIVEDEDTGKTTVTATRTDGGEGSPGWRFPLSFNGETTGDALALLDDDADETMLASDWKERYIELYNFKTPGRCSLCRTTTSNEANEELRVRLCKTCIVSGMMIKTNVLKVFSLVKKDLDGVPFKMEKAAKMYFSPHVRRVAYEKHGGKEKFIEKQVNKKIRSDKAAFQKIIRAEQATLVDAALKDIGVDISLADMITNKIEAAGKLSAFKKSDSLGNALWCSGLTKLLEACKSEGATLIRQENVRQLVKSAGEMASMIRSQSTDTVSSGHLGYYSHYGTDGQLGDGDTIGWFRNGGHIRAGQCKLFPLVQRYLLDGEDGVVDPDSAGETFTEETFVAWWKGHVEKRDAKFKELTALIEDYTKKCGFSRYHGFVRRAKESKAYKDTLKLADLPESMEGVLKAILKECNGWIKEELQTVKRDADRVSSEEAAREEATSVLLAKVQADWPELVPNGKDLQLFENGVSWCEQTREGYQQVVKCGSLALLYSKWKVEIKAKIGGEITRKYYRDRQLLAGNPNAKPGVGFTAKWEIDQAKVDEWAASYKTLIESSTEYEAAKVKKGWQRRVPLLLEDADVKDAIISSAAVLGGGSGGGGGAKGNGKGKGKARARSADDASAIKTIDFGGFLRSALDQYKAAALSPVMVQDYSIHYRNNQREVESDTLPWKCTFKQSEGKKPDDFAVGAHDGNCLCGDDGPAVFKAAVLDWAARRDALFAWLDAKKCTLPELMQKGQPARKELYQYLARPLIECNPTVMKKAGDEFTSLMPLSDDADDSMESLAEKMDMHEKDAYQRIEELKKMLAPIIGADRANTTIDKIVKTNNDNAAAAVAKVIAADSIVGGEHDKYKQIHGHRCALTDFKVKVRYYDRNDPGQQLVESIASSKKFDGVFPMEKLIAVLNGESTVAELKDAAKAISEKQKIQDERRQEVKKMYEKVFGSKEGTGAMKTNSNYRVRNLIELFCKSGSAADKKGLLAEIKDEKQRNADQAIVQDRRAKLDAQLKLCPVWQQLQDAVQLHVRHECAEYQKVSFHMVNTHGWRNIHSGTGWLWVLVSSRCISSLYTDSLRTGLLLHFAPPYITPNISIYPLLVPERKTVGQSARCNLHCKKGILSFFTNDVVCCGPFSFPPDLFKHVSRPISFLPESDLFFANLIFCNPFCNAHFTQMEEVSLKYQTCTASTLSAVVNSRKDVTHTHRGRTVVTKEYHRDDHNSYDAWQVKTRRY